MFFEATVTQAVFIMEGCLWWLKRKLHFSSLKRSLSLRNGTVMEVEFVEVKHITGGFIKIFFSQDKREGTFDYVQVSDFLQSGPLTPS